MGSPTGGAGPPGLGGSCANTTENVSIKHTLIKYFSFFLFIIGVCATQKYINTYYKYNTYYYKTVTILFNLMKRLNS